LDLVILKKSKELASHCRRVLSAIDETERNEAKQELQEFLIEFMRNSQGEEFENTIGFLVGQVLAKRQPITYVPILSNAVWELKDNCDGQVNIPRLLGRLKKSGAAIFRAALSSDEVRHKNNGKEQFFTLSALPERVRKMFGIKFSVSRRNTNQILRAYDFLIKEANEEKNNWMAQHWTTQKEIFEHLIKARAPKLLESPKN
jgi:hypothetical protein